jgi:hypothetical protein
MLLKLRLPQSAETLVLCLYFLRVIRGLCCDAGVLTQLGIVLGIMSTQIVGFRYSTPTEWRFVLFLSSVIGCVQLVTGYLVVESPAWLGVQNRSEEKKAVSRRLWRASATRTTRGFLLWSSNYPPLTPLQPQWLTMKTRCWKA